MQEDLGNLIISQFMQHRRDSDAPHPCFFDHPEQKCSKISIISHVISKSLLRSHIAANNQVYMPSFIESSLKSKNYKIEYKLTGIKKATSFYGFCQKHDNEIFADIDGDNWMATEKQIILGFYRSLCFEIYQKVRVYANLKNIHTVIAKETNFEPEKSNSFPLNAAIYHLIGIRDVMPLFLRLHELIYAQEFAEKTSYASWSTREALPIACFGIFSPEFDVCGKAIQRFTDTVTPLESVFLAIIPNQWGSSIVAACLSENSIACDFINVFMREEKDRVADIAMKLIIGNCDNHCCNPVWYDNLSQKKKKDILTRLRQVSQRKTVYRNFPKIVECDAELVGSNMI